jgi:hypothetical protein
VAQAERAWLASVACRPNLWAYRNLAVLERERGNHAQAQAYYDAAVACPGAFADVALCSEYLLYLVGCGKHQRAWELYLTLPGNCLADDRISITVAKAALALGNVAYLEEFFTKSHHAISEGETTLTDLWFGLCALRLAAERGIENPTREQLDALADEAWDLCPPDASIDFRMSLDRKNKYRI